MGKLPGIQVARAIAALSIAYYHSWTALVRFPAGSAHPIPLLAEYGWLAIDLFFGISGYVICLVVTKADFSPVQFFIKRAFRIYPLWMATMTAFAIMALTWRPAQDSETLGYFLYSATLLPTKEYPFYNLGWTLQHEMAFYVLAAITVPIAGVIGLAAVLAASAIAVHLIDMPWYLHQLASFHAEFLAGILAYLAASKLSKFGSAIPLIIGIAMLCAVITLLGHPFVAFPLFFIVVGFANLDVGRALTPIGDSSYSIYLLHPLFFWFVSAVSSKIEWKQNWMQEPIRFATLATIIIAAQLIWKFFEKPMIQLGNKVAGSTKATVSATA